MQIFLALQFDDVLYTRGVCRTFCTYIIEFGCFVRRNVRREADGTFAVTAIDLIQCLLQTLVALSVACVEKRLLHADLDDSRLSESARKKHRK